MTLATAFARRRLLFGTSAALAVLASERARSQTPPKSQAPPNKSGGAASPATPPANLESLASGIAIGILGVGARDPAGQDMGPVVDVLVDRNGMGRAAVIDFGGFLGVGSRKIAIDWHLLKFDPGNPASPVTVTLDRARVQDAPEYKPVAKQPLQIVGPLPAKATPSEGK